MPTYKHAAFIEQALRSVVCQKVDFHFEVIVCDDCSPDETLDVALEYERNFPNLVRVLSSDVNIGMQANFRRAVSEAKGMYIAFCEGDDVWTDINKLALQTKFLEDNSQYGAVHSEFNCLYKSRFGWKIQERFQASSRPQIPTGDVYYALLSGMFIQTCTFFCRAELAKSYYLSDHPYQSYQVADWPLCLFIAKQAKIGYLDEALATYRIAPGSATNLGAAADLRRALNAIFMINQFCTRNNENSSVRNEAVSLAYQAAFSAAFDAGDIDHFKSAWQWLISNDRIHIEWRHKLKRILMHFPAIVRVAVPIIFAIKATALRLKLKKARNNEHP